MLITVFMTELKNSQKSITTLPKCKNMALADTVFQTVKANIGLTLSHIRHKKHQSK